MHRGHLDGIMRAKKENDKVFVIVCGYNNEPRAGNINMTLKERTAIVRKIFRNDEIINVLTINDSDLGIDESMSRENWIVWQNKVAELLYDTIKYKDEITWYVAEPFYKEMLEKYNILKANVTLIDKVVTVSGTVIRDTPLKYWNRMRRPVSALLRAKRFRELWWMQTAFWLMALPELLFPAMRSRLQSQPHSSLLDLIRQLMEAQPALNL